MDLMPQYKEVALFIKNYIKSKGMSPDSKLPGCRKFAEQLGVSKNTVYEALSLLESEGVVDMSSRSGTYVAHDAWYDIASASPKWEKYLKNSWQMPVAPDFKDLCRNIGSDAHIYLSSTSLDSEFALQPIISEALNKVAERVKSDNALNRYNFRGQYGLRCEVARLLSFKKMNLSADEVLLAPSESIALDVIFRGLLNSGNIAYVSENISSRLILFLNSLGIEIVPVPLDESGMSVRELKRLAKSPKSAVVIVNPSTPDFICETMSQKRRYELLEFCRTMKYPIIEINSESDLNPLAPPPLKSIDMSNNVIYIGSLPKSISRGINVAWIVAPHYLNNRLIDILVQGYHYPFNLNYLLAEELLSSGAYDEFMKSFVPAMRKRMNTVNSMLEERFSNIAEWNRNARYGIFILKFSDESIVKKLSDPSSGILFVSNIKLGGSDKSHIYIFSCGISENKMETGLDILSKKAHELF